MYLTIHTPTSLIIGSQIHQPVVAFILAFVIHLILDIIPHDPKIFEDFDQWTEKKKIKKFFIMACIDFIVLGIFLIILFLNQKLNLNNYSMWAAIAGGLMPDILWGINDLSGKKIKILNKYGYFHHKILHSIIKKDHLLPWKYATIIQGFIFVITLLIYLKIF